MDYRLNELRSGQGRIVDWGIDPGIIGFPSFHCVAALLNGWALWKIRSLRLCGLVLNLFMIAATPIMGGHYLLDLISGAIVAVISVSLAESVYPVLAMQKEMKYPYFLKSIFPRDMSFGHTP